jgi:hypothetical protein
MQDESGALYGDLYKDGLTNVFAVRPWTLTASTNATSYQPGSAVAFSVVTSMLPKNLLTGLPNQMQIVMDDGTKVAMTYRTATPDGDTVWSGAYSLPHSVSSGVHSYAVEANAAGITTDVPVHFNPSEVDSNGTGLVASGSFLVVTKGATVRVTSSQATSYFGRPVTLTATVTPAAPSSEVVFSDGPVRLGSAPLDARGRASFTTSALGVGSHYVFAACGNDSSNTVLQTVLPVPTATTLSSSADSAHVGQVATFTAIVSADVPGAGTPSGAVTFMDTGTTLISVALDATGRARYATSWLDAGSHQITAAYTGSANLAASESRRLVVNVRR